VKAFAFVSRGDEVSAEGPLQVLNDTATGRQDIERVTFLVKALRDAL
jgi:hypothetical protein